MNKETIFRQLYDNAIARDLYFDKLPSDIAGVVVDNQYVELLETDRAIMLEYIFGKHRESVEWFLYEWHPGYTVAVDGVETDIYNIDQYIEWMKKNEGFDE